MTGLLLRRASTAVGHEEVLAIAGGVFVDPAALGPDRAEVDLGGRPVLPGLADHHVHLFALAAADRSVDLSPDALAASGGIVAALRVARREQPEGWLRGVGYDVAASGPLDRWVLDPAGVGPVRVQDRTGIRWVLDSRALDEVLPDPQDRPTGVEVADGAPTGVLVRLDHWLGHRVPDHPVDLTGTGRRLAALGITAVSDAGADNTERDLQAFRDAGLPFRVSAMTRDPSVAPVEGIQLGPVKVLLDDADLPTLSDLTDRVTAAHAVGRAVAVHCVSDVQVVLALAAGIGPADRIEHASLVPDDLLAVLAAAGPTVVVQPGLVHARGDRYLREVDPAEQPGLHRLASLRRAGLRVALSSDAPYGPADPWVAVATAVQRRTAGGVVLGPGEAVDPMAAVRLFAGHLHDPGTARTLAVGEAADLVVLDAGWEDLAGCPPVLATLVAGAVTAGVLPG